MAIVDVWTTKSGKVLQMSHMTDLHITNAINFMRRNAANYHLRLSEQAIMMPEPQGDMAQYMWANEVQALFDTDPMDLLLENPSYCGLVSEARKRNLEVVNDN